MYVCVQLTIHRRQAARSSATTEISLMYLLCPSFGVFREGAKSQHLLWKGRKEEGRGDFVSVASTLGV